MTDWKGTRVLITIYFDGDWTQAVHEEFYLLDTDTLADLFERYPPENHNYEIMPWGREDD